MFLFLIVGAIFFLFGSLFLVEAFIYRRSAQKIKGTVVGFEKSIKRSSKNSSGGTYYYAVVEFTLDKLHRFKGDIGSSSPGYEIGEEVIVLIHNNDPSTARIKRPARLMLGAIFAVMGLVFQVLFFNIHKGFSSTAGLVVFTMEMMLIYLIVRILDNKMKARRVPSWSALFRPKASTEVKPSDTLYVPSKDFIRSPSAMPTVPRYVHGIFFLVGISLLIAGIIALQKRHTYLENATSTMGKIIDSESSYSDGSTVYAPIIRYRVHNQDYTHKGSVASSHPSWHVGDTVRIFYAPHNPKNALIDDGWMNYLWQGALTFFGLLLSINGMIQLFKPKKPKALL